MAYSTVRFGPVPGVDAEPSSRSWKTWSPAGPIPVGVQPAGVAEPNLVAGGTPFAMPASGADPQQISIAMNGATPQQLESAYGTNQISFGSIKGNGAGQTVAIVDAYDNPGFLDSSDPNFGGSFLAQFDKVFGLPNPPSFTKFNEYGDTAYSSLPPPSPGIWSPEIALDIEAVHLMARRRPASTWLRPIRAAMTCSLRNRRRPRSPACRWSRIAGAALRPPARRPSTACSPTRA